MVSGANASAVPFVCPRCRGHLTRSGEEMSCQECGSVYPIVSGIPDLRVEPDPYLDLDTDRARARTLSERAASLSFRELLESYYADNTAVTGTQARMYTAGAMASGARSEATLAAWECLGDQGPEGPSADTPPPTLLDLGCGHGPLLVAAARAGHAPVGVDIGLRWLVLARKRLQEAGLDAQLVCACAEALPFPANRFDFVAGESVLENTRRPETALREAGRVLKGGGSLHLSVPNRLSFGPDPQTGIWLGGWLPQRWVAAWIRRKGGVAPRRHLFSARTLTSLLERAGFTNIGMGLPSVPDAVRASASAPVRLAVDLYRLVSTVPVLRRALFVVGPTLLTTAAMEPAAPPGA